MNPDQKKDAALEARSAGDAAYFAGLSETDNPYDHGTDEHLSWNDGYMQAAAQDQAGDDDE